MAHVAFDTATHGDAGFAGWVAERRAAFAKWRLFRKTLSELASLPDGLLADLGLSRAGIRAAAYSAVYGA
ncbi:DUF1127 domain-containing protein [Oceanicella sp. SM1341]|uniref:DUF1127 domain-containing protein n=1 Tax=Oceanicella sp. SM1341 TaxID=1548889 RepID=UPI000E4B587B|nr:DUF1127 domain-containing protein [Oceanicella sp. SM1341]